MGVEEGVVEGCWKQQNRGEEEKEEGEGREGPVLKLNARAPCSHRQRFHGYRVILASKEISFTLV